jgi:sulfur-oxidizing protein SoxZ
MLTRRRFTGTLLASGLWVLAPATGRAQGRGPAEHVPTIQMPILAEDATAVPLHVWVDHPMEPGHWIRWLEVRLPTDPVPHKGKFSFTPANGRAAVAFHFRSGIGGLVTVTGECSRHGRFAGSREVRVADGGCATGPERPGRERIGNPLLRLPPRLRVGEIVEVRAKVDHASHTGLVEKGGKFVRALPAFYVRRMLVHVDDRQVSEFEMTPAVSPNPLVRFPLRVTGPGTLRVTFVNSEGQRWEAAEPLRPGG